MMIEFAEKCLGKVREWLRTSSHVHIHEKSVDTLGDVVDLIDRFIDGRIKYALEWDDFISWKHNNTYIEELRIRLGQNENLMASKVPTERKRFTILLLEERNKTAALAGLAPRSIDTVVFSEWLK